MSSESTILRDHFEESDARQQPGLLRRYNVERSCLRCHERKVRCNKAIPCTPCIRAKAQCRYPGPEKTKRRAQKDSRGQVGSRLDRLERALDAIGAAIPERAQSDTQEGVDWRDHESSHGNHILLSPPRLLSTSPTRRSRISPAENGPNRGVLVMDGASTRYINEAMLSQMLEKETELQSAMSTPDSRSTLEKRPLSLGFHGLISNPNFIPKNVLVLHPSRGQAARLWQTYLNNVNPIMRVLHIPTVQPAIFAAIKDPTKVPADLNALLFSIYFASVTSIEDSEAQLIMGHDRQTAVNVFQQGLEIYLQAASFLDSPTVTSLQAFSIYLMCRRNHNGGLSGWALNGLLTRAAQAIGLHRDGENFKLSPFECEVRRRLWWQIVSIEGRVAEDHGLFTGEMAGFSDTRFPLNANDTELTVDMKQTPEPTQGWTEMSAYLLIFETNRALQQMHQIQTRVLSGQEKATRSQDFLEEFKTKLHSKYTQYLDWNIPTQKFALCLGHVQVAKLEVLTRQQYLKGIAMDKVAEYARDETLVIACEAIQWGTELRTDELVKNYQWITCTFPQYFLLTYSLWHLCIRPDTESADHAWNAIETSIEKDQPQNSLSHHPKWNVIKKLRDKAMSIRQSYLSRRNAASEVLNPINQEVPTETFGEEDMFNMAIEEGMMWDLDFNLLSGFQAYPTDSIIQGRAFGVQDGSG